MRERKEHQFDALDAPNIRTYMGVLLPIHLTHTPSPKHSLLSLALGGVDPNPKSRISTTTHEYVQPARVPSTLHTPIQYRSRLQRPVLRKMRRALRRRPPPRNTHNLRPQTRFKVSMALGNFSDRYLPTYIRRRTSRSSHMELTSSRQLKYVSRLQHDPID